MLSESGVDSQSKQLFHWFYCKMFRFWFTSYFMSISQPTWTVDSQTSKIKTWEISRSEIISLQNRIFIYSFM